MTLRAAADKIRAAAGQIIGQIRRRVAGRGEIVRLLPRAGLPLVIALAVLQFLLGVLPVAFVLGTSIVLGRVSGAVADGTGSRAWGGLIVAFAAAAAVFGTQQILIPLANALGELLARRIDGLMYADLMSSAMGSSGVAPLEDQAVLGQLRVASAELEFNVQSPGQACAGMLALLARYTQLAGYLLAVAVAFSWLAAAGLAVVVLLFRHGHSTGMRKYARERRRLEPAERKADYLRRLAIQAPAAKEIRVFGLAGWLTSTLNQATLYFLHQVWAARRRVYMWPFIRFAVCGLALSAVGLAALGAVAAHQLTLTSFALVAQAAIGALRLGDYYPDADLQLATGMVAYNAIRQFAAGLGAAAEPAGAAPGETSRFVVADPVSAIHFDRVTFGYPGSPRPVFDGLDLKIPIGRCTAIVGVNGAGKTTLIKLLSRLYEPTSGAVRADGVDIGSYPVDAWRAKLGVIFQDFLRYETSAEENIGYGAIGHLHDRAGIRAAAAAIGLDRIFDSMPEGVRTPLARHMTGGADLSGGQWQRVALARALFALRHGSPILVLDEPTASMDVRAEAGFFREFSELATGATTVLISHRFATVRHADLIVVLEDGRVIEQGGHDELLAMCGRYAQLFRLQADRLAGTHAPEITAA
jgi:ATP-binding cassette, subfamily B, bacterial